MENLNDEFKRKNEIRKELRNKTLFNFICSSICLIIMCIFCGWAGYSFSSKYNYNIFNGIVFGSLIPIGIYLLKYFNYGSAFTYIIFFVLCIVVFDKIPLLVGFVIWFLIIFLFIFKIINICKDKMELEVNTTYIAETVSEERKNKQSTKPIIITKTDTEIEDVNELEEYEYYCDRCEKRIDQEEYEEYAGLCEDCYIEVNFMPRYENDDFDIYR